MMKRFLLALAVAGLLIGLGVGWVSAAAGAPSKASRTTAYAKRQAVRHNTRLLQLAVQYYATDHHELYPPNATSAHLKTILMPYFREMGERWPTNPYTHRPIVKRKSAGNFTYRALKQRTNYRMTGWGLNGKALLVVP
jgi:hypothetical protein